MTDNKRPVVSITPTAVVASTLLKKGVETVTMEFFKRCLLRLQDNTVVEFLPGVQEVPADLAEHMHLEAYARIYKKPGILTVDVDVEDENEEEEEEQEDDVQQDAGGEPDPDASPVGTTNANDNAVDEALGRNPKKEAAIAPNRKGKRNKGKNGK